MNIIITLFLAVPCLIIQILLFFSVFSGYNFNFTASFYICFVFYISFLFLLQFLLHPKYCAEGFHPSPLNWLFISPIIYTTNSWFFFLDNMTIPLVHNVLRVFSFSFSYIQVIQPIYSHRLIWSRLHCYNFGYKKCVSSS